MNQPTASVATYSRVLVHVVWATARRAPVFLPGDDTWIAWTLDALAREQGVELLAAGNGDDHVHVVLKLPVTVAPALVLGRLAAELAQAWAERSGQSAPLAWEQDYWVESVSPHVATALVRSVWEHRKRHDGSPAREEWEHWLAAEHESAEAFQR